MIMEYTKFGGVIISYMYLFIFIFKYNLMGFITTFNKFSFKKPKALTKIKLVCIALFEFKKIYI